MSAVNWLAQVQWLGDEIALGGGSRSVFPSTQTLPSTSPATHTPRVDVRAVKIWDLHLTAVECYHSQSGLSHHVG
jgi:hypothetical protein